MTSAVRFFIMRNFKERVLAKYDIEETKLPFPFNQQGMRPKYNLDFRSGELTDGFLDGITDENEDVEDDD